MGSENNQSIEQNLQVSQKQSEQLVLGLPEQYELIGSPSQGAMGAVYRARNRYTDAKFAIKVLKPECADDEATRQRFILEAKATSALKHSQICQVFDFGCTANGVLYLVMEWIDGISLKSMIDNDGPLPYQEALPILQQIVTALGFAHRKKLVHRDLKPANIMLSGRKDGSIHVHLVDFGVAKLIHDEEDAANRAELTKVGSLIGTPCYMSPEQARGKKIDQRADIYAFGCLMFYVLSGRPPFVGDSFLDTVYKHIHELPPEIEAEFQVPADLKLIMLKALEKKKEDRYQSMEQIGSDLEKLSKGISIERRPLAAERQKVRGRLGTVVCFILGFILMYIASIALQSWLGDSPTATNKKMPAENHKNNDSTLKKK